jgi:hypothetical protein
MKTDSDLSEFAKSWAASQEVESDQRSEADWEVVFAVQDLGSQPEELWRFIVIAEPICRSNAAFGMLGTGPLEDLIAENGPAFIDRLEAMARDNRRFAKLFAHVWIDAGEDALTQRYLALGCVPRGPLA